MRRAQAAMDYIMTYGWAVLGVFALIGILGYFGVLSPEKFRSEECIFIEPGLKCISVVVNQGSVSLSLQNDRGMEIIINKIKMGDDCSPDFTESIATNGHKELVIPCPTDESGARFKADLEVTYTEKDTSFTKTVMGAVKARVQ